MLVRFQDSEEKPDSVANCLSLIGDDNKQSGQFAAAPMGEMRLVAVTATREVVGIASGGPNREDSPVFTGELYGLYVIPEFQRRGIGRKLVEAISAHLLSITKKSMLVWSLSEEPYRRFYEKLGGLLLGERVVQIGGASVREVAYGWMDLQSTFFAQANGAPAET